MHRKAVKAVLGRAGELLKNGGWCRNAWALDAEGEEVGSLCPSAAAWCTAGATNRAMADLGFSRLPERHEIERAVSAAVAQALPAEFAGQAAGAVRYNDAAGRTKAEVTAAVDRAAALV